MAVVEDTSVSSRVFGTFVHITLLILLVLFLYPILHIIAVSLSDNTEVFKNTVTFFPVGFTTDAFEVIIEAGRVPRAYKWSIIYTAIGTAISMVFTTTLAYALSKKRTPFHGLITVMVIITFFFTGGLIPMFILVMKLGMYDTLWAIVVPQAIATWNLIVLRTFFQATPQDLEDSAKADGANDVTILLRIVIPISKAAIATITLFYAVSLWNSWFPAVIYLRDANMYPLPVILRQIVIQSRMLEELAEAGEYMAAMELDEVMPTMPERKIQYAVLFAAVLPMMILYPFLQRYFIKGIMIGSLKG